jgi:hypothetical protein
MLSAKAARKIANIRRKTPSGLMTYILNQIYKEADSMQFSYTWKNYYKYDGFDDVLIALEGLGYKVIENTDREYVIIEWD